MADQNVLKSYLKSTGFVPIGANLTHFWSKSGRPDSTCDLDMTQYLCSNGRRDIWVTGGVDAANRATISFFANISDYTTQPTHGRLRRCVCKLTQLSCR